MLKGNLSTRPFYNDRLVTIAIVAFGVFVLLLTAFNVSRLVTLSNARASIQARSTADLDEAARVRAQAEALQGSVDGVTLARLAGSTREANQLIDQRTFSWTHLLGQLERTLPDGVRLTAISPRADRGAFRVSMAIIARELDDVDVFVDALRDTGRFYDVAPTEQRLSDDTTYYRAVVEASYLPERAIPQPAPPQETRP